MGKAAPCTESFVPTFLEHRDQQCWVRPRTHLALTLSLTAAEAWCSNNKQRTAWPVSDTPPENSQLFLWLQKLLSEAYFPCIY